MIVYTIRETLSLQWSYSGGGEFQLIFTSVVARVWAPPLPWESWGLQFEVSGPKSQHYYDITLRYKYPHLWDNPALVATEIKLKPKDQVLSGQPLNCWVIFQAPQSWKKINHGISYYKTKERGETSRKNWWNISSEYFVYKSF